MLVKRRGGSRVLAWLGALAGDWGNGAVDRRWRWGVRGAAQSMRCCAMKKRATRRTRRRPSFHAVQANGGVFHGLQAAT